MADFYQILELTQSADSTQIRAAYKRLAMRYHPDRNPGNPQAEEMFKSINEAYHILSDPLKKARYDARFHIADTSDYTDYADRIKYAEWQRQQYVRWQAKARKKEYVFDKHYFKIQGFAFLAFLIMSGICFGIIHTANYFIASKYEKIRLHNQQLVMEVNALFGSGKIDEAITRINSLHEKEPLEFQFIHARDSLVNELRAKAEKNYTEQDFNEALRYFKYLAKYEFPPRSETLKKIGTCEYRLGLYADALQSLKQLHTQRPWDLELVYQIGMINLTFLNDKNEALYYFSLGTKLFRENLTDIYGEAFTIVMNPNDVPDIYADIFEARATTRMSMKSYREAVKDLNWVIFLRPLRTEPYKLRAIAKIRSGNHFELCKDLAHARKLGATGIAGLQSKYCTQQE